MHAFNNLKTFFCMFCDLYMCRNNLKVSFLNFFKGINNLSLTLFVHWNVGKYSDLIVSHQNTPGLLQDTPGSTDEGREREDQAGHLPLYNALLVILAI